MHGFIFLLLFFTSSSFADECRYEKTYHSDTHEFLGCKIEATTPSYRTQLTIPAESISEVDCVFFCNDFTLVPIPHEDQMSVVIISRSRVNDILELQQSSISRNAELEQVPPEIFLQEMLTFYSEITDLLNNDESIQDELWNQYVQSMIHQKDPSKILPKNAFKLIQKTDLPEADQVSTNPDARKCTICCETLVSQLDQGEEVVQLNCVSETGTHGNHLFCRKCIEESYQYQQTCPTCRGIIKPLPLK